MRHDIYVRTSGSGWTKVLRAINAMPDAGRGPSLAWL
jgi:hypothetical protein